MERDAISSQRLSGPISPNPGPRFGRLLANTAQPVSEAVSYPPCFVRFESTGTAASSQVCLVALGYAGALWGT